MEMTLEAVRKNLEYLEHYGVKGQRWGIRRTPEQLGHILKKKNARYYGRYNDAVKRIGKIQGTKTLTQLSKKEKAKMVKATEKAEAYLKKMEDTESKYGTKIEKAETRQKAAEEKVAAKEESERVKNEKLKADIMKKQDWNKAYEHKDLFSSQELNELATRINTEKKVKEALEGDSKMDKLANKLKSAANLAGAGYDLYSKVNNIKEVFDEGKKNSAYKEIRQLMADGKTAEVIKRTVDIDDSDLANFEKRNTFLNKLNKQMGTTSAKPDNNSTTINSNSNSNNTKQQKSIKDKIKEKLDNKKDKSENKLEFMPGLSDLKLTGKKGPSSNIKDRYSTVSTKVGKGRKGQTVDTTTFGYDDYTQSMMQKISSEKASKQRTEPTGTRLSVSADASKSADSWYSGKGADTTWDGINETQRKFNVIGNLTPATKHGLLAERYRLDRISESKLTDSQKRRVNEIAEAAHSVVMNNQVNVINRIVEDNNKRTLGDVKPKLSKEKVSGIIENAASDSIFNKKGSEVLGYYSGLFDTANTDYNYKKRMDKSYDILNSVSKKEAEDLKYFIPGTAYAYANDGSLDGFPFTPISGYDPSDAGKIAKNKPWKDYELKHFMKFMKTLEHAYINNKKEARKIIDKYEFLVLNYVGDFKLSDLKK